MNIIRYKWKAIFISLVFSSVFYMVFCHCFRNHDIQKVKGKEDIGRKVLAYPAKHEPEYNWHEFDASKVLLSCESTILSDSSKISEDENEEEDVPLTATNRTEKTAMFGVLIRVPKAASESMVNRSRQVIHQNKFNFLHSVCYGKHGNRERTTQIERAYSKFLSSGSRPFLYDQHVYYPDKLEIKVST